ncbi:hypothetical protein VIGAN_01030000 [Vigna angularis var. angularis]|uniref:Uncharacterized protein n=1 Tax=Vigna angularis var. angularis TaxID=157739 RepID=A0A0S3QWY1_PHAAN|nr:hypothetical protein VIGAN_01030000 [Vigna angularis var. angularis]
MVCSKYIPQPAFAFKMYCWRDLSRANMNSGSKTACMGIIGNTKNASRESSMIPRISRAEGAKHSLFAPGIHTYSKKNKLRKAILKKNSLVD